MLEGLSQIAWSSVRDAYGPARKAPRYIRDLASPDEGTRAKAYDYLDAALLHQGFVYEATFYAVPFLLELLADPRTPQRDDLAGFLAGVALSIEHGSRDADLLARPDAHEHELFARIREALTAGNALYWSLATDQTAGPDIRLLVHVILRTSADKSTRPPDLLRPCRNETDERVRASWLYLAHLLGLTDSDLAASGLAQDGSPLVRWTAAVVDLRRLKERVSARAIEEIASALPSSPVLTLARRIPLFEHVMGVVSAAAAAAGETAIAQLRPGLMEHATRGALFDNDFTVGLLSCAFGEPPVVIPESLSQRQKEILRVVAEFAWPAERTSVGNLTRLLGLFGLHQSRYAVQTLLRDEMPLRFSWPRSPRKVSQAAEPAKGRRKLWWRFW